MPKYALIVIDAQNEFSKEGQRPVFNVIKATQRINELAEQARVANCPIAWIRHFNKPNESKAFVPDTWGSAFLPNMGPQPESKLDVEFHKEVFGVFSGTDLGVWLDAQNIKSVLIVGFYTHACVATTTREALMRDYDVSIDYNGTGSCDITHDFLGRQTAEEVRRSALLHLANMGANILGTNEMDPLQIESITRTPMAEPAK